VVAACECGAQGLWPSAVVACKTQGMMCYTRLLRHSHSKWSPRGGVK
jgi:hypothetical protein